MKNKKNFLKSYHTMKFVELILLIIIEISYFLIIYTNNRLRTAVYANRVLFTLCCMMWAVLIFSLIFLCLDFYLLRKAVNDNYDLNCVAYYDSLTGMPNRNSVDRMIHASSDTSAVACVIFRISNISDVNASAGHEAGDGIIRGFCSILERVSSSYGFAARNGGNDFLAILSSCDDKRLNGFMDEVDSEISSYNDEHKDFPILVESSSTCGRPDGSEMLTDLIAETAHKIQQK